MGLDQQARSWPTPDAAASTRSNRSPSEGAATRPLLAKMVQNWPTPRAEDSESCGNHPGSGGDSLTGMLKKWPTPRANDPEKRGDFDPNHRSGLPGAAKAWPTPTARFAPRGKNHTLTDGHHLPHDLSTAAQKWPTPCANPETPNLNSNTVNGPISLGEAAENWPTPVAKNCDGARDTSMKPGSQRHPGNTLVDAAEKLWPTPRTITGGAESAERKKELGREESGGAESAERKKELGREESGGGDLQSAAEKWPTPAARDYKGANSRAHVTEVGTGRKHMDQLANSVAHSLPDPETGPPGMGSTPSSTPQSQPRRLNPNFVEWLMGFPPGWTDCGPAATGSFQWWLRTHSELLERLLGS